jgi:hypothetical protein
MSGRMVLKGYNIFSTLKFLTRTAVLKLSYNVQTSQTCNLLHWGPLILQFVITYKTTLIFKRDLECIKLVG